MSSWLKSCPADSQEPPGKCLAYPDPVNKGADRALHPPMMNVLQYPFLECKGTWGRLRLQEQMFDMGGNISCQQKQGGRRNEEMSNVDCGIHIGFQGTYWTETVMCMFPSFQFEIKMSFVSKFSFILGMKFWDRAESHPIQILIKMMRFFLQKRA